MATTNENNDFDDAQMFMNEFLVSNYLSDMLIVPNRPQNIVVDCATLDHLPEIQKEKAVYGSSQRVRDTALNAMNMYAQFLNERGDPTYWDVENIIEHSGLGAAHRDAKMHRVMKRNRRMLEFVHSAQFEDERGVLLDIENAIDRFTDDARRTFRENESFGLDDLFEDLVEVQCDSPHSSLLNTALGYGKTGASTLGLNNVAGAFNALQELSTSIGNMTGLSGLFDQPSINLPQQAAQAVVDIPQPVRSLYYHQKDFVTDQKEMVSGSSGVDDMLTRMKIPTRVAVYQWMTSSTSAEPLIILPISPVSAPVVGDKVIDATPMSYYSRFFRNWRGSIDVTVEVVSTQMHQGQLFIAFVPNVNDGVARTFTRDKLRTCPYTIMDVSTTRKVTQRFTYLGENDYRSTVRLPSETSLLVPEESVSGSMYVFVQNKLVAPSTVAGMVDINVYLSAGDDLEFMDPYDADSTLFFDFGILQSDDHINSTDVLANMWKSEPDWGEEDNAPAQPAETTPVKENSSIETTSVTDSRVYMIDQLKVRPSTVAEAICANVATAHTKNVAARDYLVRSDIAWRTSMTQGFRLTMLRVPEILWQDDLAITGLRNYHAYQHMDFEVRFKVNPSKFHAGKLIAFFTPDLDTATLYESPQCWTQYNHAFIDLQGETECVLKIPYSYYSRMMTTAGVKNYGYVSLAVWNVLRTGKAETDSDLSVSAFIKPIAPFIGVKCVKLQSKEGPSDEAKNKTKLVGVYKEQIVSRGTGLSDRGYVNTRHMSLKDLLRRPDFLGTIAIPKSSNKGWHAVARIPVFGGRTHQALIDTYTFWSGSNKLTFITNLGTAANVQLAVGYSGVPVVQPADFIATDEKVFDMPAMNGMTFVDPLNRAQFTVEVPMYKITPLVRTIRLPSGGGWKRASSTSPYLTDDLPCRMPMVTLYVTGADTAFDVTIFHSAGDDFQVFLPRAMCRYTIRDSIGVSGLIPRMTSTANPAGWKFTVNGTTQPADTWFKVFDQLLSSVCKITTVFQWNMTMPEATVEWLLVITELSNSESSWSATALEDVSFIIPAFQRYAFVRMPAKKATSVRVICNTANTVVNEIQIFGTLTDEQLFTLSKKFELLKMKQEDEDFVHLQSDDSGAEARVEMQVFGISSCVSKVQDMFKDTRAAVDGLRTIGELASSVEQGIKSLANPVAINNALQFISKLMDDSLMFVSGVLMVSKGNELMQSIGLIQLGKLLMGYVAPQLSKPQDMVVTQSYDCDYPSWVKAYAKYAKAILAAVSGYSTRNLRKYVDVMVRGKEGMNMIMGAVEAVLNYMVQGDKVLYVYVAEKATKFVKEVACGVTDANLGDLKKARTEIDILTMSLERERLPQTYMYYSRKLDESAIEIARQHDVVNSIPEPIGVYINALPGVGKSTVLCKLLPALLMHQLGIPVQDYDKFTVNMTPDDMGRVDNYDGQPFAIIDEFGSNKESGEAALVLKLISQFSEPVQSAFMDKKGKTFRSRIVTLLTNMPSVGVHSAKVNNPEAYVRRFLNRSFQVSMKRTVIDVNGDEQPAVFSYSQFHQELSDVIDKSTAESKFDDVTRFVDSYLRFRRLNILTGQLEIGKADVTFGELVRNLKEEWVNREEAYLHADSIMKRVVVQSKEDKEVFELAREPCEVVIQSDTTPLLEENDASPAFTDAVEFGRESDIMALHSDLKMVKSTDRKRFVQYSNEVMKALEERHVIAASSAIGKELATTREQLYRWLLDTMCDERPAYPGLGNWLTGMLKVAGVGVAVAAVAMGLRKIVSLLTATVAETQSGYSNANWKIKPKPVSHQGINHVLLQDDAADERHEKIRRNLRKMRIRTPEGEVVNSTTVTCLSSKLIVTNNHFIENCKLGKHVAEISEHDYDGTILKYCPISLSGCTIMRVPDDREFSDLVVVHIGAFTISKARDITAFLISKQENAKLVEATLLALNYDYDIDGTVDIGNWHNVYYETKEHQTRKIRVTRGFRFSTASGDCGRPYVQKSNRPLLGFHCAAYASASQEGIVGLVPLYKEDLDNMRFSQCDSERQRDELEHEVVNIQCEFNTLEVEERVAIPMVKNVRINGHSLQGHQNPESQIVRMKRNGVIFNHPDWPDNVVPASLRKFGDVSPWKVGISKYVPKQVMPVPYAIHSSVCDYWCELIEGRRSRIYSLDEAINGVASSDGMRPLQWSTGMGIWKMPFKESGKRALFVNDGSELEPHYTLTPAASVTKHPIYNQTFVERLREFEDMIRHSRVPFSPWIATLKDELRPREKVELGKTRIFEQPGIDYTIMLRKYFGHFLDWYKGRAGFEWSHGIGQDKETVWGAYFAGLHEVGDGQFAFDLDYSGYDGSVCQQAFNFFQKVTDRYYQCLDDADAEEKERAQCARHALIEGLRAAHVLMKEWMIQTSQGNKSGNAMTDVFNSVTNIYIIHCAILVLQMSAGLKLDAGIIHTDFRILVYGDDAIISESKEVSTWCTPGMMSAVLTRLGYKVTSADKGDVGEFHPVHELQFLKSHFVERRGVIWAPMPEQDIVKELQWVKKSVLNDDQDFQERIRRTRAFMAHWGKERFDVFTSQLRELGVPRGLLLTTWESHVVAMLARQAEAHITHSPAALAGRLF